MSEKLKDFGASLYFMNDKNIHDGLLAKRIKVEHLSAILKNRGIIVSESSTKNELVEILKTIRFDYFEYIHLSALLENPDRKDSKSRTDIKEKIQIVDIQSVADNLQDKLKDKSVGIEVNVLSAKKIQLEASYIEIDYTQPPMRQKIRKKAEIEININSSNTIINFPATKMGKILKDAIVSKVIESSENAIQPVEIDFEHKPIIKRSEFFTKLISSMNNYDVYDVVGICLKREGGDSNDEVHENFTGTVRNAVLTGRGILTSKIYGSLPSQQYYIYKIIWKIRYNDKVKGNAESDCFTIEAQFDEPDRGKGFKFLIKSMQRYTRDKLNSTANNVDRYKSDELSKLVYESAMRVYEEVITDEVITGEVITDEVITDEVITDEVITDEVITDEVITDEVITDEVITDEVITDKVIAEAQNE
jgi:hypothetical protein